MTNRNSSESQGGCVHSVNVVCILRSDVAKITGGVVHIPAQRLEQRVEKLDAGFGFVEVFLQVSAANVSMFLSQRSLRSL